MHKLQSMQIINLSSLCLTKKMMTNVNCKAIMSRMTLSKLNYDRLEIVWCIMLLSRNFIKQCQRESWKFEVFYYHKNHISSQINLRSPKFKCPGFMQTVKTVLFKTIWHKKYCTYKFFFQEKLLHKEHTLSILFAYCDKEKWLPSSKHSIWYNQDKTTLL